MKNVAGLSPKGLKVAYKVVLQDIRVAKFKSSVDDLCPKTAGISILRPSKLNEMKENQLLHQELVYFYRN